MLLIVKNMSKFHKVSNRLDSIIQLNKIIYIIKKTGIKTLTPSQSNLFEFCNWIGVNYHFEDLYLVQRFIT